LASYKERVEVWVELGLQSASDKTAKIINRGYGLDTFHKAMKILNDRSLLVVVHLMLGLPEEGDEELLQTIKVLNGYEIFGIKIHSTYVMDGTVLGELYKKGEYTPISKEDYVRGALTVLKSIDPQVVVHRLTGDPPRDMLLAPAWTLEKNSVIEEIRRG
jgi:radical SAM protein (TIGR01212 family)